MCLALGALIVHATVTGGAEVTLEGRALEHLGPWVRGAPCGQVPVLPSDGHQLLQGGGGLVVISGRRDVGSRRSECKLLGRAELLRLMSELLSLMIELLRLSKLLRLVFKLLRLVSKLLRLVSKQLRLVSKLLVSERVVLEGEGGGW